MAHQRSSRTERGRKAVDSSGRYFSELAAQTFEVLGWQHADNSSGGSWSLRNNVLSDDARDLRLTLVNDAAPRAAVGRGLGLGRDVLFDRAALGHYLGSSAVEVPTGQITLRRLGLDAQRLAPDNLTTVDRLLIESAPGKQRMQLLQWLDSGFRDRSRSLSDATVLCVPLVFRAANVPEGRLLQEVVLALERNLLFRYSQLVVPLIRTGYIALLIDGIEAWAEGGRLDPNHGSLGSFLRLVGPTGRFVLTCDRRHVIHESAPADFIPDYLLPVGKRFFQNPSLWLASYDGTSTWGVQGDVTAWLGGPNRSGFFGQTERQRLLDALVVETARRGGGGIPASIAIPLALEALPEGWRLLPNAGEALDTLRDQPFCRYDGTDGFRFDSDGDHETLLVDWMVRRFSQDANIESILSLPDIPGRVLRAFVERLGDQRERFVLTLERYLAAGEPKGDARANGLANGLRALSQLREEATEGREFWPERVSLRGASNLARMLLAGRQDRPLVLKGWDFSACNLFQASFFHVHFSQCHFDSAYLAASQFVSCVFEDCSLRAADLTGSRLVDLAFKGSNSMVDATFWSSVFEFRDVPQPPTGTLNEADTRNTKGLAGVDSGDSTDLPGLRRAVAELESGNDTLYPSHRFAVSWRDQLEFRRLNEEGCQHRYVVPDLGRPDQVQAHDIEGRLLVAARWANLVHVFRWDGTEGAPEVTRPSADASTLGLAAGGELALHAGSKLKLFEPGIALPRERDVLGRVICVQPLLLGTSGARRLGAIVGTKDGRVDLIGLNSGGTELLGRTVGFGPPVSINPFDVGPFGVDRFVVIWEDNAIEVVDPGAKEFSILRVNTPFKYVHRVTADPRRQTALIVGRYSDASKSKAPGRAAGMQATGGIGCALLDLKWGQLLEYWEPEPPSQVDLDAWVGSVRGPAATARDSALTVDEFSNGLVVWKADIIREMLGPENLKIGLTPAATLAGEVSVINLTLSTAVPLRLMYTDRGADDERRQSLRLSCTMALAGRATKRRIDKAEFRSEVAGDELRFSCELEALEEDDYPVEVTVSLAGVQHTHKVAAPLQVRARNPYQGSGTAIKAGSVRFFGREIPLLRATERLEGQCVGVRGSSHSGKTSFLSQLIERLVSRIDDTSSVPLIPAFVNLENAMIPSLTSATVLTHALSYMKGRYDWYPKLDRSLQTMVTEEVNWAKLMNRELSRLLRPGALFVLVLDEFGYVWKSNQLAGALHGLSNEIRIVAAGLPLNFKRPENDFSGSGVETIFSNQVSLGPLPETEARSLITEPLGAYWKINDDAIDEAIRRSSRMPHDLQVLMQRSLELADAEGTATIRVRHIQEAFELVVDQYERFDGVWEKLKPDACAILAGMIGSEPALRILARNIDVNIDVGPLFDVGLVDYEAKSGESLYLPCGYVERLRRKALI